MHMATCITKYSFRVSERGMSGRQFHNPHSEISNPSRLGIRGGGTAGSQYPELLAARDVQRRRDLCLYATPTW